MRPWKRSPTPMPSQHKHPPIRFRPPEADRVWLLDYAKRKGLPVNRVLAQALALFRAEYRRQHDTDAEEK